MNDKIILAVIQARTRIMRGDPIPAIKDWLLLQGIEQRDADIVIAESMRERAAKVHKTGLFNLLLGSLLVMIASLSFVAMAFAGVYFYSIIGIAAFGWVIGLWRLTIGIETFLGPDRKSKKQ